MGATVCDSVNNNENCRTDYREEAEEDDDDDPPDQH